MSEEAMERAADLWGSRRTWFLVGGSTCGILAAIRAAAPFGSEVIAARNCHRSVFHAIELGGYKVHWIMPEQNYEYEICGEVATDQVREAVRKHPCSAALILTSPTYEGFLSDIRGISQVCAGAGIPLIFYILVSRTAMKGLPPSSRRKRPQKVPAPVTVMFQVSRISAFHSVPSGRENSRYAGRMKEK